MHTEAEPSPIVGGRPVRASAPDWPLVWKWTTAAPVPARDFLDVLDERASRVLGTVPADALAAVLRHATRLRFRREDGRFGVWESRSAPCAGGVHATRLLVLPMDANAPAGLYDEEHGGLRAGGDLAEARALNARSVAVLTGARAGTTLQLAVDRVAYETRYHEADTLVWRDAGALCAIIALVATSLDLGSVVLGRAGDDVVRAAGMPLPWAGAGAVHVSGPTRLDGTS